MSLKTLLIIIFIIGVGAFITYSYFGSKDVEKNITDVIITDPSLDDELAQLTPGEMYRITMKNAMPEVKVFSTLLLILLIIALACAKLEIGSDIGKNIAGARFETMVSHRDEKLAAIEEKRQVKEMMRVDDQSALNDTIRQLEQNIKDRNP